MLPRNTITPDDYYDLARNGTLSRVWEDSVSSAAHGWPLEPRTESGAADS